MCGRRNRAFVAGRVLVWAVVCTLGSAARAGDFARDVDPFIGTGGHGHTYPGATLPFGMVQLSPDTRLEGWDGCSGYHASDSVMYGFSHTHLSGTGVSDYGDVLFMPMTGVALLNNGAEEGPDAGYASRFDKREEDARPGWYGVRLADNDIYVELTATERTGLHRYSYPPDEPAHLIVDLAHRDPVVESGLRIVGHNEIEGFRRSNQWAQDQHVYFVARFSRAFVDADLALDREPQAGALEVQGTDVRGAFSFGTNAGVLLVKVGISAVDIDGARRNLDAEQPGWDFDAVRDAALATWNEVLGRVVIDGASQEQRTIFYTALYHSMIAPNVYSDVDGRYRGMDDRIHVAEDRRHYTVFSLWDTFRATHPLMTLLEPERTREWIATFLDMHAQGGRLPVWELAAHETDTMIGYHSVSVIADAWLKGIRGFDGERALEAMLHSARLDHFGLRAYQEQGFIGAEDESESVSKTLEYAYDDWCIARFAAALGHDDVAREFDARSQAWRHVYDPTTRFMRARRNQMWVSPFDPRRVDFNYTEANAWQYSFFVPHDVESLIEAMGGDTAFVAKLDSLFDADPRTLGRDQPDITGLVGQYAHGNEPSHHVAWLYHYAGRPDRSIQRVHHIANTLYTTGPAGLCGNEDCGQLSSWYVFAALGLYPVCPGSGDYVLASPLFDDVQLRLGPDHVFTVRTGGTADGPYVQSAMLDGEPLARSFIRHEEILRGGELIVELGPAPSPTWGRAPETRPRSRVAGPRVVAAPVARAASHRFRDSLRVELASSDAEASIRYASAPSSNWRDYERPLVLRETAALRFFAERNGRRSPVVTARFQSIPRGRRVQLRHRPAPQYSAGGDEALIDGLHGGNDWRTGAWHGYRETDFEALVDLGSTQRVTHAGARFLQDVRSWIWMPVEVVVSVSTDGKHFVEMGRIRHDVAEDSYDLVQREIEVNTGGVDARYVRIVARNYGTIPQWHPGRGERAWIFVDEILIR